MATRRLYYTDSYQREFAATLTRSTQHAGRTAVVLNQSCFYPTSGGQPHDLGTLADQPVLDVVADEAGAVLHVVAAWPDRLAPGAELQGTIDWPRRYDHMQQHSGQHLLSHMLDDLFGYETVAVHFGAELSTVEVATAALTPEQLERVETATNACVFQNLPIHAYFVDEQELASLPLRRPPKVTGQVRIVEIDKFDYSACGGTHVRHTGEIGPLKLVRQEKIRGHARIAFLCGWRALRDYGHKSAIASEIGALFSTDPAEAPQLVAQLQAENRALQRDLAAARESALAHEAAALRTAAPVVGKVRLVAATLSPWPPADLKLLAQLLQAEPQTVALLTGTYEEKVTAVIACSEEVALHAGQLLRRALAQFGGGSGGRRDYAQGGGIMPEVTADFVAFARQEIEKELTRS